VTGADKTESSRRRLGCTGRLVGAAGIALAGSFFGLAGAAHAQPETNQNTYNLTAEGDGELYEVQNAQLPAATTEEVSPYSAQAANDSSGNSTAFAGLPYLGPVAETIEGTVNGLSGGATPPLPPAPGYVSTTYPGASTANEDQGPYVVQATSSQFASSAQAGLGVSPNAGSTTSNQQVFSKASVVANPDGSVSSTASAGVDGLNIGILDALNVSSTETITETGSGAPQISGSTNLGTFTLLGFTVGITAQGFDLAGANLLLPTNTILSEINNALGKNGTQIQVLPSITSTDPATGIESVTSSSLQVTTVQNAPALGPTTLTYDFGRVTVSAADVAPPSTTGVAPPVPLSPSTTSTTSIPASAAPATASTVPSGSDDTGSGLSGGSGLSSAPASPGTSGGSLSPSLASTPADVSSVTPSSGSSNQPQTLGYLPASALTGTSLPGVYLVLVLAGFGVVAGMTLFRRFAVRLALH
jgi:hypothetical protein